MVSANIRRVFALNILLASISFIDGQAQGVPPVKFQAFKPKGFRAYLEYTSNLRTFAFHGNVNKQIQLGDGGSLSGEAHKETDGKWIFEDRELKLRVGDVINYYVLVLFETAGFLNYNLNYFKDNLSYTITELEELPSPVSTGTKAPTSSLCKDTLTSIFGDDVPCSGQIIFEENFDNLRERYWKIEHYIPIHHNEIPFVSYQRLLSDSTVTAVHGNLRIAPIPQQDVPGYSEESITSGTLNLFSGCTSEAKTCYKAAQGADILPPIVSGRITSKSFAFRYGTIHVRARLPLGDWIYPEILLEPFQNNRHGPTRYASGVLKIACARGNSDLNSNSRLYGSSVLYGGPIMDAACHSTLLKFKYLPKKKRWGDEFHIYTMRWEPDRIVLSVDGVEWGRAEPPGSGLVGLFPENCTHVRRELLGYRHGSKMAPFNDFFYIALGVAVGGITEFPDNSHTGNNRPKPWTNTGRKAMVTFWQDMDNWINTWEQPELLVDYVRVVAL